MYILLGAAEVSDQEDSDYSVKDRISSDEKLE